MSHARRIGRKMNREIFNFGFSGNAFLDFEIAELMSTIDAGVYVLDFVPNASVKDMDEKMEKFYRILRDKHPNVPILFIEDPIFPHSRFDRDVRRKLEDKNVALKRNYDLLVAAGEKNIYYLEGDNILGNDGEATVDGVHFTDLGYYRFAELMMPIMESITVK